MAMQRIANPWTS
ncbi:NPCBM-associated, NEW3 domain of alpha-galactosidase family protein, partial [Vibrio parahaemolyticus EKP-021]